MHREIPATEAAGEYTGVAKFSTAGAARLREHYHEARRQFAGKPFREAAVFEKAYLILLFQQMIEAGVPFTPVTTQGGYMEIDTQQDFDLARRYWK
jgi:phosphoenolpyruvate phosphomutase